MIKNNDLPQGWANIRLGEVARINYRDPKIKDLPDDLPVTFLPMAAVDAERGVIEDPQIRRLVEVRKGFTPFQEGDVLFAKITPSMENGKAAIGVGLTNGLGFGSTEFHAIRPESAILSEWVFYFIRQIRFRMEAKAQFAGTAGQLRVPKQFLENHIIPVSPIDEQKRIVAKIEELFAQLDAGVAELQKAKAQLKRYRQAVLKAAVEGELTREWREAHRDEIEPASVLLERILEERRARWEAEGGKDKNQRNDFPNNNDLPELPIGWVWSNVEAIAVSMKNGIYKGKEFYSDSGIACLRMYNIENGMIIWKDIKRMLLTTDELEAYRLAPGDILVNRVNSRELVGKSAVIPAGLETSVYESKNIRLRLFGHVECQFINYWFRVYSQGYFNKNAQQTVGMASINQAQLGSMPIPIAPAQEQKKIIQNVERRLSVADEIERQLDQSSARAGRLRQSILKRAFDGKLVKQDPEDEPAEYFAGENQAKTL